MIGRGKLLEMLKDLRLQIHSPGTAFTPQWQANNRTCHVLCVFVRCTYRLRCIALLWLPALRTRSDTQTCRHPWQHLSGPGHSASGLCASSLHLCLCKCKRNGVVPWCLGGTGDQSSCCLTGIIQEIISCMNTSWVDWVVPWCLGGTGDQSSCCLTGIIQEIISCMNTSWVDCRHWSSVQTCVKGSLVNVGEVTCGEGFPRPEFLRRFALEYKSFLREF